MFDFTLYTQALYAMLAFACMGWVISVIIKNVTIVDSMWSLFFLITTCVYAFAIPALSERALIMMALVAIWSLRLCLYLSMRNWGGHEDHRYQAIRSNNEPHFWLKSIYIVFILQTILAWIVGLPLLGGMYSDAPLNILDFLGVALWLVGFSWEVIGDYQLKQFKANPNNQGKVLKTGLWGLSRHPNYFGECCLWWGFCLIALATGAWWSVIGALLMTVLLLKISGVALLEKDIAERRPAYAAYIQSTNAFLPWPTRKD